MNSTRKIWAAFFVFAFALYQVTPVHATYQYFNGAGPYIPHPSVESFATTFSFFDRGPVDATGEKLAQCGYVWFSERAGTKDIRTIGFRFGAVTKAGGSALTVSLQDMGTSNGTFQPDETQDQTVAIANGDAGFAANTWINTGNLSADRTVSYGAKLCVVVEFDGSGRQGSDVFYIASPSIHTGGSNRHGHNNIVLKSGGWGASSPRTNVTLGFSDGSYGTLLDGYVTKAINTHTYNSSSTPDEYMLGIREPFKFKVDALWAVLSTSTGANTWDFVLYNNSMSSQASCSFTTFESTSPRFYSCTIAETEIPANTTYYVAVKPTNTTNLSIYSWDVDVNGHMNMWGGTAFTTWTRTDAGSASETNTRHIMAGARMSAVDDGAGGGGSSASASASVIQ